MSLLSGSHDFHFFTVLVLCVFVSWLCAECSFVGLRWRNLPCSVSRFLLLDVLVLLHSFRLFASRL